MVIGLAPACHAMAQPAKIPMEQPGGSACVRVVPGAGFLKGDARTLVPGSNWRSLWNTPIELPLLDLSSFAGGLTPFKKSGDQFSSTLLLKGDDGKVYSFRPMLKDPARELSPKIHGTPLEKFIREGASSLNPVAELILPPLLEAAGLAHVSPRLVVMPHDQARLGGYADEFSGVPGLISEQPTGAELSGRGFMGAQRVAGTDELLHELDRSNGNTVDARAYLRARLMDILVGDANRAADRWSWAGYGEREQMRWVPVPMRQYLAFSRKSGPVSAITRIQNFGARYPKMRQLAASNGKLDRRILSGIDRSEWEAVALDLQQRLGDNVIIGAVRQMPPEMFAKEGKQLEHDLMLRRDRLVQVSTELYRLYAEEVDIITSEMPEYAIAHRLPDGRLDVSIFPMNASAGLKTGEPLFHRVFVPDETKEIRVYLAGGNDIAIIDGPIAKKSVVSRFIGGRGRDRFEDHTGETADDANRDGRKISYFYDREPESVFVTGSHTVVVRHVTGDQDLQGSGSDLYEGKARDTGRKIDTGISNLRLNYSPDYGALIGWGVKIEDYGFNYDPYRYRAELGGAVAYGEEFRYRLRFNGDLRTLFSDASLHLEALTSTLDNMSYYGPGNETYYNGSGMSEEDFETRSNVTTLGASLRWPPRYARAYYLEAGIESKWVGTDPKPGSFMDRMRSQIPGMDVDFTNNLHIGYHYDTRDSGEVFDLSPRSGTEGRNNRRPKPDASALSGMTLDLEGKYYPEFIGNRSSFGKVRGDFRAYIPLNESRYSRIAFRLSGQKNWGSYPYFEAASVGGSNSIRGYDRNRFTGDAAVQVNSELRLYGGQTKIFVPVLYGPLMFVDTGRVFLSGESSSQWHTGVGGGLWIAFFEPRYSAHLAVARGLDAGRLFDGYGIYAQAGFSF